MANINRKYAYEKFRYFIYNFLGLDFQAWKNLLNVISSISTFCSKQRYDKLHSLSVFIDLRCGVSTRVSDENKHSQVVDVQPVVTATSYNFVSTGAVSW